MGRRTHIRVIYTLNPNCSEDLFDSVFGPFHLLTVDCD